MTLIGLRNRQLNECEQDKHRILIVATKIHEEMEEWLHTNAQRGILPDINSWKQQLREVLERYGKRYADSDG